MAVSDLLDRGHAALECGRWADACEAFEASLLEAESCEALNGIADALWWLCDALGSVRYRERAWVRSRLEDDRHAAGRAALDLSISYLVNLGNAAAARGWLGRAARVTSNLDPNPLQGWIWLMQGYMASDPDRAHALIESALEFGQTNHDADLELVALADLGLAHVTAGEVERGLALLDEAMAGTLGGEYRRLDTVVFATCNMLAACQLVGDLERATQWCQVAEQFMATYGCPFLYASCRTHYGGVLVAKGRWAQAEEELRAAIDMSVDAGLRPRMEAVAQLAELRVRQGRLEEAEALLSLADDASDIGLAAAAIRLARGERAVAAGMLERRVAQLGPHHIEVAPTLAMLVDAHLGDDAVEAAAVALGRLQAVAAAQDRGPALALAALASARVAMATQPPGGATGDLERALEQFSRLDLPLETARVRLELARCIEATDPARAVTEATRALKSFEQLGAATDANRAAALLRDLGASARVVPRGAGALTPREREVLALVGLGLSNPEIAGRLYISRKTASHHVSNLLAKLGLRNRAEAVSYVASHPS